MEILIVDDEPMIRQGLKAMVAQLGDPITAIHLAENGEEALNRIEKRLPDVVLTDIRMPRMDGLELCRELAQRENEIPVIVISGYHDFEYAQKCLSYGVKEYILKPVNKKNLHDTLLKLIGKLQKQRAQARLSAFDFEPWIEAAEDAIWTMQDARLEEQLDTLREQIEPYGTERMLLSEFLQKLYAQLARKLQARNVALALPAWEAAAVAEPVTDEATQRVFEAFAERTRGLLKELRTRRKGKLKDPIEEAKEYIDRHLAKEVSLEEVAEQLGFNPSYFSQLFKLTTNETFVQYRIKRRMERAKQLLEQPHYRIVDISYEIGYADHAHFTKTFKKMEGCSPSEYRQKLGID
ncbi:response regulator [Paenibacillus sp. HJGM_3]|uniref:response regulator n=1 Tax=Paenibacillus sp. HJGM_3 TaxID=3379816 RepID=UPI00385F3099